jgi:hypothetical protein
MNACMWRRKLATLPPRRNIGGAKYLYKRIMDILKKAISRKIESARCRNNGHSFSWKKKEVKKLEFNITISSILDKIKEQGNRCYFSKIEMFLGIDPDNPLTFSIDRLDSSKGYTNDNTVLVCAFINRAKHTMSQDKFKECLELIKNPL